MNKSKFSEFILKYKMTPLEIKALNIAFLWEKYSHQEFPNERHVRLRKNSDPRKSSLFKYCYKLSREIKNIIPDDEIKLYVKAQLQILKLISDGKIHSLIEPQILVGDKAWKRWKLWKKSYDKKMRRHLEYEQLGITTSPSKIKIILNKDYEFLNKNNCNEIENFINKVKDKTFETWVANGQISPYYVILSPYVSKHFENNVIDATLYRPSITPDIEVFFKEKFCNEF
jgi:hypothetical protein